ELGDRVIDEAVVSAGGNMQHAVTLRKHLASIPPGERRVEAIPRGLHALLTLLWRRVANNAVASCGLGILCAAREPLTLDEIAAVAGWSETSQREAFKHTAFEFLIESRRGDVGSTACTTIRSARTSSSRSVRRSREVITRPWRASSRAGPRIQKWPVGGMRSA